MKKAGTTKFGAWMKKHVFVAELDNKTKLAFSFIAIVLAILPVLLVYFASVGMVESIFYYDEQIEIPTLDSIGIILLLLISATILIFSIFTIVRISVLSAKKRSRAKKLSVAR